MLSSTFGSIESRLLTFRLAPFRQLAVLQRSLPTSPLINELSQGLLTHPPSAFALAGYLLASLARFPSPFLQLTVETFASSACQV